MALVYVKFGNQRKYQSRINDIQSAPQRGDSTFFAFAVAQYKGDNEEERLIQNHLGSFRRALDASDLSDKVLGFELKILVVPYQEQGLRKCMSTFTAFTTACGCEADSVDRTMFRIDSTGMLVEAISSQRVATAALLP
jgi:hypothetical protein